MLLWEVEDKLHEANVFTNGVKGDNTPASMHSYGTVMDYEKLYECLKSFPYSKEQWEYCKNEWVTSDQPIEKLLGIVVQRKLKEGFCK